MAAMWRWHGRGRGSYGGTGAKSSRSWWGLKLGYRWLELQGVGGWRGEAETVAKGDTRFLM